MGFLKETSLIIDVGNGYIVEAEKLSERTHAFSDCENRSFCHLFI